jgi:hypothetical protein
MVTGGCITCIVIKLWTRTCAVNIACIIYTNDIEAEKPSEIGSYPGKAPRYRETIMWPCGLKRPFINPELIKDRLVNVIN